ncbi:hypothetical protein [Marinibactrum halimedae]|uniref:Ribosomal protein L7/L12 C-terminal domain-containing protein n=1 Tax=Marinibactrum halimedae TaxID=1444977 RepID=A0AA37TCQ9_9GAMM|nr:hypothetical protein [Marinibactrum halimedae]MCD9458979.1 hypothetical protein [Marinibactrum halimedae]GLS26892.1 hypothetical protein GCM10007877_26110 [Marinibactrum halimedae]
MSDLTYDLVFRGDIVIGQPLAEVKQKLGMLFKIDAQKVEQLFAGGSVTLKKGLNQATAEKYKAAIQKAGAIVAVVESSKNAPRSSPKPVGNRERAARAREAATAWTLAPVGADLVESQHRSGEAQEVAVDISHLSVSAQQGNLIQEGEIERPEAVVVDISRLDVAPVGEDLETLSEEIPDVQVDISDMDLAPVGSDMGEKVDKPAPLNPDISGISLASPNG